MTTTFGTDVLGWRKKFGVLGPSTNTVVQPDFDDMRVPGVTNHYSRIIVSDAQALSDESFMAGTLEIDRATHDAVRGVMTCRPDFLVMGMSAVTFYGGAEGSARWQKAVEEVAGLKVCTGAQSLIAAFGAYGGIRKIAVVSPYYPVANAEVANFMSDHGVEVVRDIPLRCPRWTAIAEVSTSRLRTALLELDGDDVDAIVQVGTNLSMVRFAAAAEQFLAKPIIAINTATYWNALRSNGIIDKKDGFGRLFSEF
jgi:maleate isomerase